MDNWSISLPSGWGDFNELDEQGRLPLLREDLSGLGPFELGTRLRVLDVDGHSCEATIADVEGDLLTVTLDWSTWVAPRVLPQEEFDFAAPDSPVGYEEPRRRESTDIAGTLLQGVR